MDIDEQACKEFLNNIAGWDLFEDGFIELVENYRNSRYFPSVKSSEIFAYAAELSKNKCEVHFGPALRKEDLGSRRSDRSNLFYSKCLWLDIDCPDKELPDDEKLLKSKEILDNFLDVLKTYSLQPSYIISSGHGYHLYFVLRKIYPIPSDAWEAMQGALTYFSKSDSQAKDATRLLRVPQTINYKNPENPKPVEFVTASGDVFDEKDFAPIVDAYQKSIKPLKPAQVSTKPLGFTPPCIEHLLEPTTVVALGHRHEARLIVGTFAFNEGWDLDETIQKVAHFTDDPKNSKNDIKNIYSILQQDPNRYSVGCKEGSQLRALVTAGVTVCDEDRCRLVNPSASEEEVQSEFSAKFDGLVDLVVDDNKKLAFLVKEDGRLLMKERQVISGSLYVPPPIEQLLWLLPRGAEVINHTTQDTDSGLFDDLVRYLYAVSQLPNDNHYKFLVAWLMHTYLTEKCEYSPIPWFYGLAERGKTRMGKALIHAAYRGVRAITIREAHILRIAQNLNATIFFDMMDLWKKAEKSGAEDIMLGRFEKGAKVPRVLYPEKGKFQDTVYFEVFGATITATNEPVDEILSSRTIQIVMPESSRRFDMEIKPEIGLPFRERLLGFRARWMDRDLPVVSKPCDGRLGDILKPLRQIVRVACTNDDWFMDFVQETELKRKQTGAESLDAQIVDAIVKTRERIQDGHVLNNQVLLVLNDGKPEKECITSHKLGRSIARLGFEKYSSGQQRGFYWNEDLVIQLCRRFGIDSGTTA